MKYYALNKYFVSQILHSVFKYPHDYSSFKESALFHLRRRLRYDAAVKTRPCTIFVYLRLTK